MTTFTFIAKRRDLLSVIDEQCNPFLGKSLPDNFFYASLYLLPEGLIVRNDDSGETFETHRGVIRPIRIGEATHEREPV
jgi:hypothetical protein